MPRHAAQGQRRLDLKAVEEYLGRAEQKAEELWQALDSLPEVDEEGGSDCPFAKELYEKKEALQQEVETALHTLKEYSEEVQKEIVRVKGNMVVISSREDQLHGDRAREHFSEAEVKLAAQYKRLLRLRDRIQEVIEKIEDVIRAARSRVFPGGQREGAKTPAHPVEGGADEELEALLELEWDRPS